VGARTSRTYDALGGELSRVAPSGVVTAMTYDAAHRLAQRTQPEGVVTFGYTPTGLRQVVQDARGATRYGYDPESRLTSETMPTGHGLTYTWDEAGRMTAQTGQVGGTSFTETYAYDAEGRRTALTTGGVTYTFAYDATDQLTTVTHPSGVVTAYGYDARDRLASVTVTGPGPASPVLLSLAYTRTSGGHILSVSEGSGEVRTYTYDDAERLTSESVTQAGVWVSSETFAYDAAGNRTARTWASGAQSSAETSSYDARDRVLSAGGLQCTWDEDGRLQSKAGPQGYSLTWDSQDRLVSMTYADGTAVRHVYDADGIRVASERLDASGAVVERTDYLVSTVGALAHVVAESTGSGLGTRYVRAGDRLLGLFRGTTQRGFHGDHLGSVRLLTDGAGAVTDRYSYSAFGSGTQTLGTDAQPYRFAGEPFEGRGLLSYNRARWMDPSLGMFMSLDPYVGGPGDTLNAHRLSYVGARPVDAVDPTGLLAQGQMTLPLLCRVKGETSYAALPGRVFASVRVDLPRFVAAAS
jgi:RHS repeat-associated protein